MLKITAVNLKLLEK